MGVGEVSPLSVFVHTTNEVLDFFLSGSISNGREAKANFLKWPVNPFRGKDGEEACGLSK